MLKKVAIAIAVIVVTFLAYCATKPDTFQVERSATINAPAEKIFPYINDLHNFSTWSPYEKMDPNMKRSYSGPESGPGAVYAWDGNNDVGKGAMTITKVTEPSNVTINLHFDKPFEGDSTVEFNLQPEGTGTKVTWSMSGKNEFLCKVMQTFFDMHKMCGKDFETGLQSLKALAEM